MGVLKVIKLLSSLLKSCEEATDNAIIEASNSIKNIKSVNVQEFNTTIKNYAIEEYCVNEKIPFEIES